MSRRRWTLLAGLVVVLLVLVDAARRRYDLTGIARSWSRDLVAMHTSWRVATPDAVQGQIDSARLVVPRSSWRTPLGPLVRSADNPRYFEDPTGRIVYLTGSHTWSNFQDNGPGETPPPFDYGRYLDFLEAHNHNFFRLWVWEGARWTVETRDGNYRFHPDGPFLRTGPGTALDGEPRWDLTRFDDRYFDRLRTRVTEARRRGIYVSVMLFNGWSVSSSRGTVRYHNPWLAHPFHHANNINGVDGDVDADGSGEEIHELGNRDVLAFQEAYVRRVVDAVTDLDNVLYEISNESHNRSVAWQYHMIRTIREYEDSKSNRHPVGMTSTFPGGRNADLYASPADWISPNAFVDPLPWMGRKVVLADTDHIWGIGGDRAWVWRSVTRGLHPVFMDGYDGAGYGVGGAGFDLDDPQWVLLRRNLGYARFYIERLGLAAARPAPWLCASEYCIGTIENGDPRLLVYFPEGRIPWVDLSGTDATLSAEWLDPRSGERMGGAALAGGGVRSLRIPFDEDAVLFLTVAGRTDDR